MLKNRKIRGKILIGFVVVSVIAVVIGLFGVVGMQRIDTMMMDMYTGPTKGIYYSTKMESLINALQAQFVSLQLHLGEHEVVAEISETVHSIEAQFDDAYQNYLLTNQDGDARDSQLLQNVSAAYYEMLVPLGEEMLAAVDAGDEAKALGIYNQMLGNGDAILGAANELVVYNQDLCIAANADSTGVARGLSTALIVLLAVGVVVSVLLTLRISGLIAGPIGSLLAAAKALAKGDVELDLKVTATDEIGELAEAFSEMTHSFQEQAQVLRQMAEGDYTVQIERRSEHDVVNAAIRRMIDNINQTISEIQSAATQVASGSQEMAQAAQNLATGSSQQAATLEEFSAAISEVLGESEENTRNAQEAFADVQQAGVHMEESLASMKQMTGAMQQINESAGNIAKVIKVIDDIAFQTNILALNAAVEAARAGQHGKGFAVVADEVRNLASKSAAAAKETAALIESSTALTAEGNRIATVTSSSLSAVGEIAGKNAVSMNRINEASQRQSMSIAEITQEVGQISAVVQDNSATAQQSAASAEEMSAQAHMLGEVVARFKLRGAAQPPEIKLVGGSREPEEQTRAFTLSAVGASKY